MISAIFTFVAAAAIIYLSYLCSKYIGKNMNKSSSSKYMRLIDQIVLGQDKHIAVIEVSDKYLLVGVTAGQINILTEFQKNELEPLMKESAGTENRNSEFRVLLEKLNNPKKKGGRGQ